MAAESTLRGKDSTCSTIKLQFLLILSIILKRSSFVSQFSKSSFIPFNAEFIPLSEYTRTELQSAYCRREPLYKERRVQHDFRFPAPSIYQDPIYIFDQFRKPFNIFFNEAEQLSV
uniref:Uncharacterized protein U61 n=1 Tax=Human herpesvirus 6A (strain Uganda-1102) TaxID=10370 RepID=U61_HHV6U|nr:RecName: Full=Uncharacterized protein U61 [Human herpesvirus 6 (strain Uganda-1102)]